MDLVRTIGAILTTAAAAPAQSSPCPPQGMSLAVSGGTLGRSWSVELAGAPFAPGVLAFDAGGGPVATASGLVCLDLGPALALQPIALGAGGTLVLGGELPAELALAGQAMHLQAVVADLSVPGSAALSNGYPMVFQAPRFTILVPGTQPSYGEDPGRVTSFSLLAPSLAAPHTFGGQVCDHARLPGLGWVAFLTGGESLECLDESTTAPVAVIDLAASVGLSGRLAATPEGSELLVLDPGSAALSASAELSWLTLPSGAVQSVTVLPGKAQGVLALPGPRAAVSAGSTVHVVDYAAGIVLASIDLGASGGAIVDWLVTGQRLITVQSGIHDDPGGVPLPGGLNAIDLTTLSAELAAPLAFSLTEVPSQVRLGPGPTGAALFVLFPSVGDSCGAIRIHDPATLVELDQVSLPSLTASMELSSAGSHWVLLRSGTDWGQPGALLTLDPHTLALATVADLPAAPSMALAIFDSDSVHEGMFVSGWSTLVLFQTDPLGGLAFVPLPIQGATYGAFSN
jgi:hypothetical protein